MGDALEVALEAALMLDEQHRPGERLVEWLGQLPPTPLRFSRTARDRFFELLADARPRSWRFLQITGMLDRALPELGEVISRREPSALDLDPFGSLTWGRLDAVHRQLESARDRPRVEHPERVELAALILDAGGDDDPPVLLARRVVQRLDLGAAAEQAVAGLVADVSLLRASTHRPDSLTEENVLQLAAHLGSIEQARALHTLTLASEDLDQRERARLDTLVELVEADARAPRADQPGREQHHRTAAQRRGPAEREPGGDREAEHRSPGLRVVADAGGARPSGRALRTTGERSHGARIGARRRPRAMAHRDRRG